MPSGQTQRDLTDDGKTRALAASRTLNPRPEKVTDAAFAPGSFYDPADLVQVKYEMVRRSEIGGVPAAAAAAAFGFSRQSLYTAKSALAEQRLAGLAAALQQRTGISVHPRSAERALSRRRAARASYAAQPGQEDPKR